MTAVVHTEHLTKDFPAGFWRRRPHHELRDVSIDMPVGEVFGLLGPNGAGKSTTLKLLLGLLWPTGGRAEVFGRPAGDRIDGGHDWILLFARDRTALESSIGAAAAALEDPGVLWIAFPKGSSKIQTDLTRDAGWESVAAADLMWLGLVSIDGTWSAFSLRHYRSGEARQAFR
jgi:energy-coupling factor transporter ATP-binding protein EcfA2